MRKDDMDRRYIDLQGTFNFRDIGGYRTKDNRMVKYNRIYRSDELSKLTPEDVKKAAQIGIKVIIDYRNEKERKNNEDVSIPGTRVVYLDPGADLAALASSEYGEKLDIYDMSKMTASLAKFMMTEQNREFVRSEKCQSAYKKMFQIILEESNLATVQHCRGGKDRTGYGIALILLTLGVSREDVIEDYLLTNYYKKEKNEKSLRALMEKTQNADLVQAVRYFKEADESFLVTALDLIDNEYGGGVNYVQKILGITEGEIQKLKDLYLE